MAKINNAKILIGIPILAWTHEFAMSFLGFWTELMLYQGKGETFQVGYEFMYRKPVHMAEEELAQLAIDSGCTHLLLMDDDIYDVNVKMFLDLLKADKDIIGGIMHANGFPHAMCALRRYDTSVSVSDQPKLTGPTRLYEVPPEQRNGIQEVDLIPFAFTLIKTSVFTKIEKPWFTCDTKAPTDSWFADSVLKAGLQPYAHFDVWLNHRGVTRENKAGWMQIGQVNAKGMDSNLVNLSPDEMKSHEAFMRIKLIEAEERIKKSKLEKMKFYDKEI